MSKYTTRYTIALSFHAPIVLTVHADRSVSSSGGNTPLSRQDIAETLKLARYLSRDIQREQFYV